MLDLIEQHRADLERLCRQLPVARLELFGSATTGEFRSGDSDLDFLVEFRPLAPRDRADAYFGLLHALEDLFRRPIDLVTQQAIQNRRFARAVDQQRTLLYAA
jgi:predicted nucleotidyltransferase